MSCVLLVCDDCKPISLAVGVEDSMFKFFFLFASGLLLEVIMYLILFVNLLSLDLAPLSLEVVALSLVSKFV